MQSLSLKAQREGLDNYFLDLMWLGVRLFIVENHLAMISIFICFNLCLYSAACRRKDFPKQVLECFTSHTSLDRCRAERASWSMFHDNISDHRHHQWRLSLSSFSSPVRVSNKIYPVTINAVHWQWCFMFVFVVVVVVVVVVVLIYFSFFIFSFATTFQEVDQ